MNMTVNVVVDRAEAIQDAGDANMELVVDASVYGENAVYMNDFFDDGGCPMGLGCPNEVTRGHRVGEYKSSGD